MKQLLISIIFTLPLICFGQTDTLLDIRDSKIYNTKEINGSIWMLDNLDFVTDLSFDVPPEKEDFQLSGRYYYLSELDSVCPVEWQLPDPEDWLRYFEYLAKMNDILLEFTGDWSNFTFSGYKGKVNLFADDNPLQLGPTGRYEGTMFNIPTDYADYWTLDAPTYQSVNNEEHGGSDHVHIMSGLVKGKTHIHIRPNSFTNVHAHDHHLNPKKEKKMRRFMVRCIKINENIN
jgi:uncharacterized protein (TIGR02145 family)